MPPPSSRRGSPSQYARLFPPPYPRRNCANSGPRQRDEARRLATRPSLAEHHDLLAHILGVPYPIYQPDENEMGPGDDEEKQKHEHLPKFEEGLPSNYVPGSLLY